MSFLAAFAARPALADKFVPLPDLGDKAELQIRVVRYDGSTNGKMVVDVRNPGKTRTRFVAEGIYFIPAGDPEKAPQRLGAAGPFTVVGHEAGPPSQQELILQPGETRQLQLDVFCIDSHRSSPSSSTRFSVAGKPMPRELRQTIASDAAKIISRNKGDVAKSKDEIQSTTWRARDRKWIKLEGERKQEKTAPLSPSIDRVQQQRRSR